jgi:hypothetical protein
MIDFARINDAALARLPELLRRWLPDGRLEGNEFTAKNPRRADHRAGSFKINIRTGKWSDFAIGVGGGDVISLASYLAGDIGQAQAAKQLAEMIGIAHG